MQKGIREKNRIQTALRAAFPHTVPVLAGYLFMGMAFGVLLASKGYGAVWAVGMAIFIYAGSAQFVAVALLAAGFNPLGGGLMILMVNARHIFYGLSMLERFKEYGRARLYMIFSLTDETFALLCTANPPSGVREKDFALAIAGLNHLYWAAGCSLGGLAGKVVPVDTTGVDFVMTAMFVVIFLEQWRQKKNRTPAVIGLAVSFVCRVVCGPQWFVLAAMAAFLLVFTAARRPLEGQREGAVK